MISQTCAESGVRAGSGIQGSSEKVSPDSLTIPENKLAVAAIEAEVAHENVEKAFR